MPKDTIINHGEICNSIIFVVNGLINLITEDEDEKIYNLKNLKQGDIIGQYSVHLGHEFKFKAIAESHVRILKLTSEFL